MRRLARRLATSAAVSALAVAFVVPIGTRPGAAAAPKVSGSLSDVDCPTPTSCFAAGSYDDAAHANFQPLVGRLTGGSWTLTPAPAPSAPSNESRGVLPGVACATATRCFAVGNYDVGRGKRDLIDQWDGKTWSIASRLRPPDSQSSALVDIACISSQRCFAVGSWNFETTTHALIAQWNGHAWSLVTVPHIHGDGEIHQSRLLSISCVRGKSCFAVGSYVDTRDTKALTMRFNGTSWRWVQTPPLDKNITYTSLSTVSCVTDAVCQSVGRYGDAAAYGGECCINDPRGMRWNGLRWLVVDIPSRSNIFDDLFGSACPATDLCLAVGTAHTWSTAKDHVLVERWDGKKWALVSTGLAVPRLNAIVCRSRTSCLAVGGASKPVVARMQNGSWSATSVPVTLGSA